MHLVCLHSPAGGLTEADAQPMVGSWPRATRLSIPPNDECLLEAAKSSDIDPVSVASEGNCHVLVVGEISVEHNHASSCGAQTGAAAFLDLFRRYGTNAPAHVNGLYCAVVWDGQTHVLVAMTDRIGGFYPLYYTEAKQWVALATSPQSLIALPWVKREMRRESLYELFATGYVLPPNTMLRGIQKLGPGEVLSVRRGVVTKEIADRIAVDSESAGTEVTPEAFKEVLSSSVARAAHRGGKRAYLLSGGIDSSIIVTLASAVDRDGVSAFSGSFPGTGLDESEYARTVAGRLRCRHTVVDLDTPTLLDSMPQIVWHLGEPTPDFSVIPTYHLLRRVAQEANVAVSGDGPDHLFCRYNPLAAKRVFSRLVGWIPPSPRSLVAKPGFTMLEKLRRAGNRDLLLAYRDIYELPTWGLRLRNRLGELLFYPAPPEPYSSTYLEERRTNPSRRLPDVLRDLTYVDFYVDGAFGVFNKVGAMARAHGLVAREPYLDREVIDFVLRLPLSRRVRGTVWGMLRAKAKGKYALKYELGSLLLPAELIAKRKGGFKPPLGDWLKSRLLDSPVERWLCPTLVEERVFNPTAIRRMVEEHCSGVLDWQVVLFLILSVDLWYRMTILKPEPVEPNWTLRDAMRGHSGRG